MQVGPAFPPLASAESGPLDFEEVVSRLDEGMAWLAKMYCNTMNIIHYMHDKYSYERIQVCTTIHIYIYIYIHIYTGLSSCACFASFGQEDRCTVLYQRMALLLPA